MKTRQTALQEISEDRCWQLLATRSVGRLAVTVDGEPDLFPINYAIDDRRLLIRTSDGRKVAGALEGPVAFEVDATDPASRSGWSVVVRGTATEAPFLQEYLRAFELAQIPWVAGAKTQVIVIDPTIVTGRLLPAPAITGFSQP